MPPTTPLPNQATTSVTNGSLTVVFSSPQTLPKGAVLEFSDHPGVPYTLAANVVVSAQATLTAPYQGTTASAAITTVTLPATPAVAATPATPAVTTPAKAAPTPAPARFAGRKPPQTPEDMAASARIAGEPKRALVPPGAIEGAWPARVPVPSAPVDQKTIDWLSKHAVG
jgi:hypothetical protein